jgi:cell division protein ZapA (FtsZ GTPase activity inhibitor)
MSSHQNKVQVEILGEVFTVKGDAYKQDIINTNVFLNEQLQALQKRNPLLTPKHLALLAAFNMAESLLRTKKDYEEIAGILDKK